LTKALVRARKVGGSIVISIPKEVTEQEGIHEGELLEIDVRKARKDWFGSLKGVGIFSKDDGLDAHD
jgi:bifunctional DNA-binding transcriptional regulator/antitoxin component of YhaV-PrlF toxin-antitoxin module